MCKFFFNPIFCLSYKRANYEFKVTITFIYSSVSLDPHVESQKLHYFYYREWIKLLFSVFTKILDVVCSGSGLGKLWPL